MLRVHRVGEVLCLIVLIVSLEGLNSRLTLILPDLLLHDDTHQLLLFNLQLFDLVHLAVTVLAMRIMATGSWMSVLVVKFNLVLKVLLLQRLLKDKVSSSAGCTSI